MTSRISFLTVPQRDPVPCLRKERGTMGHKLAAGTQVRKTACTIKGEGNRIFTEPFTGGQADTDTSLGRQSGRPRVMKPTSSQRRGDTQKHSLTSIGLRSCLSHPHVSPCFSRVAQSTHPNLGRGSTAPSTGRMKKFCLHGQEIK